MRASSRLALIMAVGVGAACSDATGPSYNSIAGTYAGNLAALTQGIALVGNFSLTITQNAGTLSGSWAMQGTLSDGVDEVPVQGTGTLSGTIAPGNNPSINITIGTGFCPQYSVQYSGAYDTANQRMTLTGPVDILSNTCAILLRYPVTFILNR